MIEPRKIRITDHAVLRYLERVRGFDVEAVRREIAASCAVAADHPAATAVLSRGFRFTIKADAVVTVTFQHDDKHRGRKTL